MRVPVRTCIGCRSRTDKSELVRLVLHASELVVDLAQIAPGRGAYVHRSSTCVEQAVRRNAAGRALRASNLDASRLTELLGPRVVLGDSGSQR